MAGHFGLRPDQTSLLDRPTFALGMLEMTSVFLFALKVGVEQVAVEFDGPIRPFHQRGEDVQVESAIGTHGLREIASEPVCDPSIAIPDALRRRFNSGICQTSHEGWDAPQLQKGSDPQGEWPPFPWHVGCTALASVMTV